MKKTITKALNSPIATFILPLTLSMICIFYIGSNMYYTYEGMRAVHLAEKAEIDAYEMRNQILLTVGNSRMPTITEEREHISVSHLVMLERAFVSVSR